MLDDENGLVTVIVPAYNREAYIRQAVDSVLEQTYPNVELIAVDDGSTDGTFEILEGYANKGQLRLFQHPQRENRGQAASINMGLGHARGEYVQILDSDDYLAPRKFEVEVSFLRDNPEIGLVYSNGYAVDALGTHIFNMHSPKHMETNDPNALLLDCYFLLPNNSLVRRSVYAKVGLYEETFRAAQDHDMLLRIAECTSMAYVSEYLFFYRRHDASISATKQDVRWRTGFEILYRAKSRYPYKRVTVRRRAAVLHFRLAQSYWRTGNYYLAFPRLIAAAVLDFPRSLRVASGVERIQ